MATYSEDEQRQMDIKSGDELDKRADRKTYSVYLWEIWEPREIAILRSRIAALETENAVLRSATGKDARARRRIRRAAKFDVEKAANALAQKLQIAKAEIAELKAERVLQRRKYHGALSVIIECGGDGSAADDARAYFASADQPKEIGESAKKHRRPPREWANMTETERQAWVVKTRG